MAGIRSILYCRGQGREYEALADKVIELVGRAQETDGYLNTYYTVNEPDKSGRTWWKDTSFNGRTHDRSSGCLLSGHREDEDS